MKKALCFTLALAMLLTLAACDNGKPGPATSTAPAFSTPAATGTDSDALSEFFGGETDARLQALSGVLSSFACAVQTYPEVLTSLPDENFGWTYLYNLIVYNGVTCDGVTASRDGFSVTEDAVSTLQRSTLGGAMWSGVGDALSDYVTFDEKRGSYDIKTGRPQSLGAYIESAAYREDVSCAELTVAVYDASLNTDLASAVVSRYCIDLRAHENSPYGYVIMAFSRAE